MDKIQCCENVNTKPSEHIMDSLGSKVYSIQQVAEILNTTQKAVRRIVASGQIYSTKVGTRYSISESALLDYLNSTNSEISDNIQSCSSDK